MRRLAIALFVAACAEPSACMPADLGPLDVEPAYAFVASDYASSAVGLLDARGELLREAWLDPGTVTPGLVSALSGDAVLATSLLAPCVLAVIDRFGTDVITLLDVCGREALLGQLDVGRSFAANPRDVVAIDDRRALVSRFTPNRTPEARELELGNDLVLIDWREPRVLSRIDLGALDVLGTERAYARPDRMVRLANEGASVVVVGLARLTDDFMVAGPGAAGVIDLATLAVGSVELEGLVNCGEVDAVPEHAELAVVTCAGPPFAQGEARREGAGIALLELAASGSVAVRSLWRASDHDESPVFNTWSIPIAPDRIVTVAMGDLGAGRGDRAGLVDPSASAAAPFVQAGAAFVLGDGAYDPETSLVLLPDADRRAIRRFAIGDDGSHRELDAIETAPCRGLPPREVRRLRAP